MNQTTVSSHFSGLRLVQLEDAVLISISNDRDVVGQADRLVGQRFGLSGWRGGRLTARRPQHTLQTPVVVVDEWRARVYQQEVPERAICPFYSKELTSRTTRSTKRRPLSGPE